MIDQSAALASGGQPTSLSGLFRYLFIPLSVVVVGWYWLSRRGPFRTAARRGGWRLAVAVLASLGMLAFGVGVAIGQQAIGLIALIVCGLPATFMIVSGKL